MPEATEVSESNNRHLRENECELIRSMLSSQYPDERLEKLLATSRVSGMHDGGMGSIRFLGAERRRFGKVLAENHYRDSDDVLVTIAINSDQNGALFELEFWKVDFSPLKRYPRASDLFSIQSI